MLSYPLRGHDELSFNSLEVLAKNMATSRTSYFDIQ